MPFEVAELPVDELRTRLHVVPKSDRAVEAGSVGPWDPGGISEFQVEQGRAFAARSGVAYDAHGAVPPR